MKINSFDEGWKLQNDLDNFVEWVKLVCLFLNIVKCKAMTNKLCVSSV